MAQFDIELHGVAAQVEVAVLEAHLFVGEDGVAGEEGGVLGLVEDAEFVGDEFDFAGGDIFVDGVGVAQLDGADDGDDELVAEGFGLLVDGGGVLAAEDDLGDAGAVADIDEDDGAEVAAAVDPSHEDGFLTSVGRAQSAAQVGTSKVA